MNNIVFYMLRHVNLVTLSKDINMWHQYILLGLFIVLMIAAYKIIVPSKKRIKKYWRVINE